MDTVEGERGKCGGIQDKWEDRRYYYFQIALLYVKNDILSSVSNTFEVKLVFTLCL